MYENLVLGIIQGIAEWLPVSSEGMIIMAKKVILHSNDSFEDSVKQALFLHLGTFFAALIYFHKDVLQLLKTLFQFKKQPAKDQKLVIFLFFSTLISGTLGLILLKTVEQFAQDNAVGGKAVTLLIGCLLLGTAFLELRAKKGGLRHYEDITIKDAIILGITQGFAALPGFSRSGLTVSVLLLRKFEETCALKLSFLMSLPIVLAGNIVMHFNVLSWSKESLVGLLASFVFGLLTIHLLLKLAEKVNFGYFVLFFAILTLLSAFI